MASLWRSRFVRLGFLLSISLFAVSCVAEQSASIASDAATVLSMGDVSNNPDLASESTSTPVLPPATLTALPTSSLEAGQPTTVGSSTVPAEVSPQPTLVFSPTALVVTPSPTLNLQPTIGPTATPAASHTPAISLTVDYPLISTIGLSVQGRPINAYQFNNGPRKIIVVGGIHGGYEWNTILLAYELIDYFQTHPETIPDSISLIIIPSANPDGQALVTGKEGRFTAADVAENSAPGRFNANNVDLNRNWDCQWAPVGIWRNQEVSGGSAPFSEPESVVLRDYILSQQPQAVIFLHSAANGVFAAGCPDTHLDSMLLAQAYGAATGYPVYERFTSYPITGDAGDWLTMQRVTTITVELFNHEAIEWPKNLAGMLAVLDYYK